MRGAHVLASGQGGQALDGHAQEPGEGLGLGLAQLVELAGHVAHGAVPLAQLDGVGAVSDITYGRGVAIEREGVGQRTGDLRGARRHGVGTRVGDAVTAAEVREGVNLVNLRENIAPTLGRATLVLRKDAEHRMHRVLLRKV